MYWTGPWLTDKLGRGGVPGLGALPSPQPVPKLVGRSLARPEGLPRASPPGARLCRSLAGVCLTHQVEIQPQGLASKESPSKELAHPSSAAWAPTAPGQAEPGWSEPGCQVPGGGRRPGLPLSSAGPPLLWLHISAATHPQHADPVHIPASVSGAAPRVDLPGRAASDSRVVTKGLSSWVRPQHPPQRPSQRPSGQWLWGQFLQPEPVWGLRSYGPALSLPPPSHCPTPVP